MGIDLQGKVAIITGASRGIGEGIALAYVAAGARVMLAARKEEALAAVCARLGDRAKFMACHTAKRAELQALFARTISEFGTVDVLVNNAATNPYFGPMLGIDESMWDKTFEVNLKGYFAAAQLAAEHMMAHGGGNIINVASVVALAGAPLQGVYAATKAGVISMTQTLAAELGPRGLRVNAIAPGIIRTKFAAALTDNEDLMKIVLDRTPLGRAGEPDDVAGGAVFLASDAARFITGHTLVIDGGLTARIL